MPITQLDRIPTGPTPQSAIQSIPVDRPSRCRNQEVGEDLQMLQPQKRKKKQSKDARATDSTATTIDHKTLSITDKPLWRLNGGQDWIDPVVQRRLRGICRNETPILERETLTELAIAATSRNPAHSIAELSLPIYLFSPGLSKYSLYSLSAVYCFPAQIYLHF